MDTRSFVQDLPPPSITFWPTGSAVLDLAWDVLLGLYDQFSTFWNTKPLDHLAVAGCWVTWSISYSIAKCGTLMTGVNTRIGSGSRARPVGLVEQSTAK
ncbi:hypothetical protein OE88DRAFT_1657396 [Heliocybe sulcata]|uniref:Uncharacterized protein n=1 Tax=Heliocybe sulcata TaxID=5364 RepID=A0A5C3N6X7_9AGAM|nr:hypothetical protein OE88DRAFT_1657396 [Heliocybe sulcata]